jgi:hypothetical protein
MPAPPVSLYVTAGMRQTALEVLARLKGELPVGSDVWVDPELWPDPNQTDSEFWAASGWASIDVEGAESRREAIGMVVAAVDVVDPEHATITGGDIFRKPL